MKENPRNYYNVELSDHKVSEEDKSKPEYLMAMADSVVESLVNERSKKRRMMLKMRSMREGVRDPEEYSYITDNYGIGNSGDLRFTPVVRNRVDALIGILSSAELDWKISIGDKESIQAADVLKSMEVLNRIYRQMEAAVGQTKVNEKVTDMIQKKQDEVSANWKNVFESGANNLINYYRDDVEVNMKDIRKTLMEDIATVGECLYQVQCDEYGQLPTPKALLPENYYTEQRRDQKLYKESSRGVYVHYITVEECLHKYGHMMDDDQKDELVENTTAKYFMDMKSVEELENYYANKKDKFNVDAESSLRNNRRYVRVYDIEWIANNPVNIDPVAKEALLTVDGPNKIQKQEYRQDRYQVTRIGPDVYLNMGKSDFVTRSKKDPRRAYLSFNGLRFEHRNNGDPYSITWKCKDIQDMTDIMYYHRDSLVGNSGVNGSRMDVSALPKFLGTNMMDRLMKSIALRKLGVEPYTSAQDEGTAGNRGVSSDFRAGVDGSLLQAITSIIQQLDDEATKITGVTPQMMGIIEQRDAVNNVKTGISQASMVMKNMYDQHDIVTKNMLTDLIQVSQISLQDEEEYFGTFLNDTSYESFKVLPRYFSFTDYNIHVVSSANDFQKLSEAKQAAISLSNTGSVDPLLLMKIIASDSLNQLFMHVEKLSGNDSGNMIAQLQQQLDELMKENEQLKKKAENDKSAELQIKREELSLKKMDLERKNAMKEKEISDKNTYQSDVIRLKEEVVKLERDQLFMENASEQSKEVKNNI